MKKIYLDYAATTPMDKNVLKAMQPYFSRTFGNPMSLHSFGRDASIAVEKSRTQIANFLKCQPKEIIFTSGATESNNLAIKGIVKAYYNNIRSNSSKISSHLRVPHIITTAFEHHCVLNTCQNLEKENLAEITHLPIYKNGIIKIADIKKALKPNTILVSIMYVNNEIGTVQPIAEIGNMLKAHNAKRITQKIKKNTEIRSTIHAPRSTIFFHTDATQAINYLNCDVKKLNVDMLSLSGHKIYGPKGIGTLYVKKRMQILPIFDGGDQELGKRAGTHNVPGIVGLGFAIKQIQDTRYKIQDTKKLRDYLIKKVLKEIPDSWLNGDKKRRSPNNANFGFKNTEGESLILMLDSYGIAASTGSACSSKTLEPSHVLLSLGLKPEDAHGSLRITLGKYTTKKEIDYMIEILKKVVKKLRNISGNILEDYYKN